MAGFIRESWLNWLLLFIPVSWAVALAGLPEVILFVASALAVIPLANLIGRATEQVAEYVGAGPGGLLNATLGNAPELIIGILALRAGLFVVVKASISGSIIGNVLLVLGLSMVAGGWGRERQTFNRTRAGANAAMLFLAVVALVMPAVFDLTVFGTIVYTKPPVEQLSILVSAVLLATYVANLIFSLRTHRHFFTTQPHAAPEPRLSVSGALLLLLVATVLVGVEGELLVGAIQATTAALGLTQFFVGVIVVAIVGNAAEYFSAMLVAKRNNMELAMTIATGAAAQIALFVAPVLVFASLIMGSPMSLVFNVFEIAGVTLSVLALGIVSLDGESTWFEGVQLAAVYAVLAIVFYFVPEG